LSLTLFLTIAHTQLHHPKSKSGGLATLEAAMLKSSLEAAKRDEPRLRGKEEAKQRKREEAKQKEAAAKKPTYTGV
jgi:hypothetical protein